LSQLDRYTIVEFALLTNFLGNPNFVYAVLRNRKRFVALRSFTLESGQAEIEQRNQRQKENLNEPTDSVDIGSRISGDSIQSPSTSHQRGSTLSGVPEETFAIGDDDDEDTDDDHRPTPAYSTPTDHPSRPSSVSSSIVDEAVPIQYVSVSCPPQALLY
jgi:High-temperature-induced dauer-formation protein